MTSSSQRLRGMRVQLVLPTLELGGAERQALLLARYLKSACGAYVEVLAFEGPGPLADHCSEHGIPWHVYSMAWPPGWFPRLRSLTAFAVSLRRSQPDIILPYTKHPNVMCGMVWRWTGAQVCIWNQRDEGRHFQGRRSEKWAVRNTPWFISNSSHAARFLTDCLGARQDQVRVVYNGVEPVAPTGSRPDWREKLGVDSDCILACMVANLHSFKDHSTLLKSWSRVNGLLGSHGLRAVLLLAGRFDNAHDSLKALAYDLELGRSIRFLGQVRDIPGLLVSVDIGVFSSRTEGCPNGILECMAAGLPVAATDIPGIREAVGENGYPFLAPPGDSEQLADCIHRLAIDSEVRMKLGNQNRQRVKESFSVQRMCEDTVDLISNWLPSRKQFPFRTGVSGSTRGG